MLSASAQYSQYPSASFTSSAWKFSGTKILSPFLSNPFLTERFYRFRNGPLLIFLLVLIRWITFISHIDVFFSLDDVSENFGYVLDLYPTECVCNVVLFSWNGFLSHNPHFLAPAAIELVSSAVCVLPDVFKWSIVCDECDFTSTVRLPFPVTYHNSKHLVADHFF